MALAGGVSFKVTTEALNRKAEEVSALISEVSTQLDTIGSLVERTQNYWLGEAGEAHRAIYREEKEALEECVRRLREHPVDLLTIAGQYSRTESEAEALTEGLSGDVIF